MISSLNFNIFLETQQWKNIAHESQKYFVDLLNPTVNIINDILYDYT